MQVIRYIFAALLFGPITAIASTEVLPQPVRDVLDHRQLPADSLSVYVEDLYSGEPVLAWLPDEPRNPASVMKMLTTLAALDLLGPAHRWHTNVFVLGDIKDGVLDGDLLLQGGGDPFLVTERFWELQRMIRQSGIRDIGGDLLIDDSLFAVPEIDPAAFDNEPLRAYNVAPNALLSNFKVVRYRFTPDGSGGVNVAMDPQLDELAVVNKLRIRPGICRGYQRGITITMNDKLDVVTFSGQFPSGCDVYSMDRTALQHNQFTYALFRSLWQDSGGQLTGTWRNESAPEDVEPDLVFRSLPLADVISRVNKHSNNVMARHLLYTLAAEFKGLPATEDAGRQVILEWAAAKQLDSEILQLDNGAGLSRQIQVTGRLLVDLLRTGYESQFMPEYVSSLSLSGHDGTLRRRFRGQRFDGQAHMKTGSLDHVAAIAGYFQSRSGKRFLVSVMQNYTDVHRGTGEEVQAAVLAWLNRQ